MFQRHDDYWSCGGPLTMSKSCFRYMQVNQCPSEAEVLARLFGWAELGPRHDRAMHQSRDCQPSEERVQEIMRDLRRESLKFLYSADFLWMSWCSTCFQQSYCLRRAHARPTKSFFTQKTGFRSSQVNLFAISLQRRGCAVVPHMSY